MNPNIKTNLVVGCAKKIRKEKNKNLKKYGLNVQDVFVPELRSTYGIQKNYVPFSQYSYVKDKNGEIRMINSFSDEEGYKDKIGVIEDPQPLCSKEIPENAILIGYVRSTDKYTAFIPIIGIFEQNGTAIFYDFKEQVECDEIYTNPHTAMLDSMNNFYKIKKLVLKKYGKGYKKLYRHPDLFNGEFVKNKTKDKINWEIKFI